MRQRAIDLLTRREHSEKELQQKLTTKGFSREDVADVVAELKREGLQSDQRFTDSFVFSRMQKGYGPVRITQELQQRGVAEHIIDASVEAYNEEWMSRLHEIRGKKFGQEMPADFKEQARQSRFLQYRGFSTEQIRRLFRDE